MKNVLCRQGIASGINYMNTNFRSFFNKYGTVQKEENKGMFLNTQFGKF